MNVLAFLLVGLQARVILAGLEGAALWHAVGFAATTLLIVTVVRIVWVMTYGAALRRYERHSGPGTRQPAPSLKLGILVSWCGMRGLVTLATALSLPVGFPGRDLIVLCAFAVVLGTLVLQGFTMRPLIAWLGIEQDCSLYTEISQARKRMLDAALDALDGRSGEAAQAVRAEYSAARAVAENVLRPQAPTAYDALRLEALASQRRVLERWRHSECIDDDAYHRLEEELDRAELNATPPGETGLVES
ncbi:MAG: cation:proton antiporter [Chitinophagaceae bacterium]|nr:cation:proton antiporter [Rubrivivax sp.]